MESIVIEGNGERYFNRQLMSFMKAQRNDEAISMLTNVQVRELTDSRQRTLLHCAIVYNNLVMVQYLIDRGCDINARDSFGNTPLHNALSSDNPAVRMIRVLLENGADANARNDTGRSPMHVYHPEHPRNPKDFETLKMLLDRGAFISLVDGMGNIAFEDIFCRRDKEILQAVLQYDVDLFARDDLGMTFLHFLILNDNNGVIELIEGRDFDINAQNLNGETALFLAITLVEVNKVEFLLKQGADANIANFHGITPLCAAVWNDVGQYDRYDRQKLVWLLLQHGADAQSLSFQWPDSDLDTLICHIPLLKAVIAHLAMMESQGQVLSVFARTQINSEAIYRDYFATCLRQLDYLKKVIVAMRSVTLYRLLTENPDTIAIYTNNSEFYWLFKRSVKKVLGTVDPYYYHALRKRVGKVIQLTVTKLRASHTIYEWTGVPIFAYRTVVSNIFDYLHNDLNKLTVKEEEDTLLPLNDLFSTE